MKMKKKLTSFVLIFALLAMFVPSGLLTTTAYAADGDFEITDGVLTGYNGSGGDVVIPDGVTAIGAEAFKWCKKLTSVTIPNSVISIGDYAFWSCSNLTSVSISTSVKTIGKHAFWGCSGLTSVTIPNSVVSIGEYTFWSCSGLTSVTISNSMSFISNGAFSDCTSLSKVTIPHSVKSIGDRAFSKCTGLSHIEIPNSVTSIGDGAFSHCTALTDITIPDSAISIGNWAFEYCSGLTEITIPHSVSSIKSWAFQHCSALTEITIPGSVTSVGNWVFSDCNSLTDIYFGGTQQQWSTITKSLDLNSNVTVHYNCEANRDFQIINGALIKYNGTGGDVVIPDGVTAIGSHSFRDCISLTDITIPNSVISINECAFWGCSGLKKVTIPNSVNYFGDYAFCGCTNLTSINIPDTIVSLSNGTFKGCSHLNDITIPNSVISIGSSTFSDCNNLVSIHIPNSVKVIDSYAFFACMNLNNITIPDSVTSIGYLALSRTDNLKDIYFTGTEQQWQTISKSAGISSNVTVHYHYGKTPLTLTSQPQNVTVNAGETAEFSIVAEGDGLTYKWQISDDDGQTWRDTAVTTAAYAETAAADSNGRCVRCIVTDKYGSSVTSDAAVLHVNIPLRIISQPEDLITEIGAELVFTIVAEGDDLTYKWQLSDDDGQTWRDTAVTTAAYAETASADSNGRCVRCVVTDKYGSSVTSDAAVLRVNIPLRIISQPEDLITEIGAELVFTIVAEGDDLTYKWQISDDNCLSWRTVTDVTGDTLRTTLTEENNHRCFQCIIRDAHGGKIVSHTFSMEYPTPIITRQPEPVIAASGATVRFSVEAEGDDLTYQWQLSDDEGKTWRNSSVKTPVYSTTLTQVNNGRFLRCIVTDPSGASTVSDAACMKTSTLTVTRQPVSVTGKIGDLVTFRVEAIGSGVNYQWQLSDNQGKTWRDSKATTATYSTTLSSANNGRYLRCVVTDEYGSRKISDAVSMKTKGPAITVQPTPVTALSGDTVRFSVRAEGTGLNYQWQLSDDFGRTWRNSSTKAADYATTLTQKNNSRYLRCIVTDKDGMSAISNATYMKISSLAITGQPVNASGKVGDLVQFSVTAKGPGITWQWQLSDDAGKTWRNSKNTTSSYATTLSTSNNGRYVRCIVTDKYGNKLKSNAASMNIK